MVVVLPTPPFWLARAMIRAGPCRSVGIGSGIGRRIVYAVGSAGPRSAPRSNELCCSARAPRSSAAPLANRSDCPPTALRRPRRRLGHRISGSRCPTVRHAGRPIGVSASACRHLGCAASTSARVRGRVHLAEPVDGDQRVDLGGRHRGVAEQFLHDPDVGAAVEQVGGVGVAQRVRATAVRAVDRQPGPGGRAAQDRPGALPRTAGRRGRSGTPPGCPGRLRPARAGRAPGRRRARPRA